MRRTLALWAFLTFLVPAMAFAGPRFSASSQKTGSKADFGPAQAFDGLLNTSWAEDAPGLGLGSWIEVDLGKDVKIETLSIWAGDFSGSENWRGRSRVSELTITGKGPDGAEIDKSVEIGDRFARKDVAIGETLRTLRFTVDEVHEGAIFADTHIAEVAFDFKKGPDSSWGEAIDAAVARSRSLRGKAEAASEELKAAYDACKANEDYSKNFKTIGWTAAHGPAYRVELVQKLVPVGGRLSMMPFDEDAIDFLGRLKDANAITYLEIASAGARKSGDREWLSESIGYFRAYQDLRRTPRATVPNWGSTGMEKGALMGRGEQLSLSSDSLGNVWVADVGNNRVQRFSPAGTVDLVLGGGKRGIVESWFGDRSEPYASAALAGEEPGLFTQPMAVSVGNYDTLLVVDAGLRVQTFDSEGKALKQWHLETAWRPRSGSGNATPLVTWLDDDFYLVVRDEVLVYTQDGQLKTRYNLEGGDVQSAVIAAGGKLLVRHVGTRDIIEYKVEDGFRQGGWLRKGVPDDGSEDWDMATDEKDNLYVVTDAGNLYKWNKRGKFIKKIQVFENPRDVPRVAVFDTLIYVTAKDEITRIVQED